MADTIPLFPRNHLGQRMSKSCPKCGNGTLQFGDGMWLCDGLIDPGHDDRPLVACTYSHQDGEAPEAAS